MEDQQIEKTNRGRPSKRSEEVIKKIEEATALDATIDEICFYADISRQTYYDWVNNDPELSDKLARLRQRPFLKARQSVVKSLDDPVFAFKYLEKRKKDEFGNAVDITSQGRHIADNAITFKEFNKDGTNSEQSI